MAVVPGTRKGKRIRYAVVGLGYVSQIAVLPAFRHANKNSELTALVSGDNKKLKTLARKHGVAATYSYDQFAEQRSVPTPREIANSKESLRPQPLPVRLQLASLG